QEFADQIRSTLPKAAAGREDASASVFALPGVELMQRLSRPIMPTPSPSGSGGVTGGATALPNLGALPGVSSLLSGVNAAALKLINYSTYHLMKERAGTIGRDSVNPVLRKVCAARGDLKLHLAG